ncbi:MAG: acetylxylan esterase [Cyclobacteriaceae bacterium]
MKKICISLVILLQMADVLGQANYDESRVPKYELPTLLASENGPRIVNIGLWRSLRRSEIVSLFEEHVYGIIPEFEYETSVSTKQLGSLDMGTPNNAIEVTISFSNDKGKVDMTILLVGPKNDAPVPFFVGYNFYGNHTTNADPKIAITESYVRNNKDYGITDNVANEKSRGVRSHRWPMKDIVERGYGVATIYYGDIDPDFDDGFENGIHSLVEPELAKTWPSISAWSWGLMRAMDYFEEMEDIGKVSVIGHSRLGKTSLWAGALDERFAIVVSNDSGCGGAALSRRKYGETVKRINTNFPHWFNTKFKSYSDNEKAIPVDQHMLIALAAPRPICVGSAVDDRWADPKGEFLSTFHAGEVYKLYGFKTLDDSMPEVDAPVQSDRQSYHIRTGGHDLTVYDWQQYMNFADEFLK